MTMTEAELEAMDEESRVEYERYWGRGPKTIVIEDVTQHYGGPEEGGWHWHSFEVVGILNVSEDWDRDDVEAFTEYWTDRYNEGRLSDVRGGVEYRVRVIPQGDDVPAMGSVEMPEVTHYE